MDTTLLSSPLQGFTDFRFRNAFHKYFGGIDTFYSPYIKLNGKLVVKGSYERDILPENNSALQVIPQIITNDAEEFLFVAKYVKQLGYNELNWNLGCPYPMVAKSGMGSGLICNTGRIDEILERAHNETDIIVSMKMRMGYDNPSEILDVFPILEKYRLKTSPFTPESENNCTKAEWIWIRFRNVWMFPNTNYIITVISLRWKNSGC